ncbi:preprotein translocase subunit SecA [bacterium]|jgi:preprotein translocase subunit SecA|nr:preprotein translocase subunit SecA [bacterium]
MAAKFLDRLFRVDQKQLKALDKKANEVEAYKEEMAALSDEELKAKTPYFRQLLADGKTLDDILPEAFAVAREAAKRVLGEFPYHVQVIGAIALHRGDVAEMKTGEGKTLTATMCIYLNALSGEGVHVVTVNEYLAKRDSEWMGAIYRFLGLTVGCNYRELNAQEKRAVYQCDITYTTNSELGFDYLRDNMAVSKFNRVLRGLKMCIIDEADSILIDESRTPLIISGGKKKTANLYRLADRFAKAVQEEKHYNIDLETKTINLTADGIKFAESMFRIDNLYALEHTALVHHIHNALKANYIMGRDVDYMVQEGEIVIVDQFTGRQLKGRTYSDGLHQAIEAKEGVKINEETSVLATITYQNFFRLYEKIGGMTGTAKTEEEEFLETYNMRVVEIPTNRPIKRIDAPDLVYAKKEYKYKAMIEEIKERHEAGQPILIGTIAVETSEYISKLLKRAGLRHEVLNAKNHEREAEIIKHAGEKGAITLATNMAGRGTDIKLGPGVKELGGLAVIGSERHEARRIDNQLRGRSGRQGDPGYSRFYVSLEDDLMLRFGGRTAGLFRALGEDALESRMITKIITSAQTRVEGANYDVRKNLLGYDDVLRQQREIIYKQRDEVIFKDDVHDSLVDLFDKVAEGLVNKAIYIEDKENKVDKAKLVTILTEQMLPAGSLKESDIKTFDIYDVIDETRDLLLNTFMKRKEEWGEEIFREVEKQILLRTIDKNWTDHIDRMAKLRDGIGLRAYANTNPLQSYVNEGYQMFQDMVQRIADETVFYCLHAVVRVNPQAAKN